MIYEITLQTPTGIVTEKIFRASVLIAIADALVKHPRGIILNAK